MWCFWDPCLGAGTPGFQRNPIARINADEEVRTYEHLFADVSFAKSGAHAQPAAGQERILERSFQSVCRYEVMRPERPKRERRQRGLPPESPTSRMEGSIVEVVRFAQEKQPPSS